ncbi:substrate-binding periplasmic protein [Chitinimonas lacunae]|uniref:Substrate-binding periplasmic protein n=1 Tax=Chitinimonas lacunae TaxID=1963018 RepID=A0ABV8MXL1_9NEIS
MLLRLLLSLALLLPLWAAETETVIVVRGDGDYPPYEMSGDQKLIGAHIELVEAAAKEVGVEVQFQSLAWSRALEMTRRGLADAISFAGRTHEREQFLLFDEGNIQSVVSYGFFARRDDERPLEWRGELAGLLPYKIGLLRNYAYPEAFLEFPGLQRIEHLGGNEILLRALLNRRIDLLIGGTVEVQTAAQALNVGDRLRLLQPTFGHKPAYLAFSRTKSGSMALALRFAAAFGRLKQSGVYQRIQAKYGLPPLP